MLTHEVFILCKQYVSIYILKFFYHWNLFVYKYDAFSSFIVEVTAISQELQQA